MHLLAVLSLFCFNDTATTEIYTLSLHDALPILDRKREAQTRLLGLARRVYPELGQQPVVLEMGSPRTYARFTDRPRGAVGGRSEEHTSELQSQSNLVCRLLLEKKKQYRQKEMTL